MSIPEAMGLCSSEQANSVGDSVAAGLQMPGAEAAHFAVPSSLVETSEQQFPSPVVSLQRESSSLAVELPKRKFFFDHPHLESIATPQEG